jgi:hypothetical protein
MRVFANRIGLGQNILRALLAAAGLIGVATSEAGILFFTNQATWSAAAGTPSFNEDFSSFATDTSFRTAPVMLQGMSIQQEGSNPTNFRNEVDVVPLSFSDHNGTANASVYVNHAESTDPGVQVRITFNSLNAALGFQTWLAADAEIAVLDVLHGTTLLGSRDLTNGLGDFLGYVLTSGDTATSVLFYSKNLTVGTGGEGFGLDNVAAVNAFAMPEPTTWRLLVFGGVAVAIGRLRRRRK